MSQIVLSQIERNIMQLPVDEQLLLISRVAEKLRRNVENSQDFENQLSKMANDSQVKNELNKIENEFHETEFDGLNR